MTVHLGYIDSTFESRNLDNNINIHKVTFPKWLPEAVRTHYHHKIQIGGLSERQQQCIIRLTTNEIMRSVWEALCKLPAKPTELIEFIEFVRLHPSIMYPELKNDKLTHARQRKVMEQISELSERLLASFALLNPIKSDPNQGVELIKSEISRLESQTATRQQGLHLIHLHQLLEALQDVDEGYGIVGTIELLHSASKIAMDAPPNGPRKKASQTAPRTLLIKDLKRYMLFHFNTPLNQVIANTVITAMDLLPESVTEDQVRKA